MPANLPLLPTSAWVLTWSYSGIVTYYGPFPNDDVAAEYGRIWEDENDRLTWTVVLNPPTLHHGGRMVRNAPDGV